MSILVLVAALVAAPTQAKQSVDLKGCAPAKDRPSAPQIKECGDGMKAAKYDRSKPENLRSNLCFNKKINAVLGNVDFSLFGHNDARAGKKPRPLKSITHVVIHNGGWNGKHNSQTWECRPAASHYTIDRDGKIVQHIGEELIAPHAGGRHTALPRMNHDSIGIELAIGKWRGTSCNSLKVKKDEKGRAAVMSACAPSLQQYGALLRLLPAIISRTSVKLSETQIIGHCETVKPAGHGDPKAFDWRKIGLSNEKKLAKLKTHPNACGWYHLYGGGAQQQQAQRPKP